jgi:hypothetical protein
MTVLLTASGRLDTLDREIERTAALLHDLRYLRDNRMPPANVLEWAPVIDAWSPAVRSVPCLAGHAYGHPKLSSHGRSVTSPLCVLSLELGFVRTVSRFWRLGAREEGQSDG